MWMLLLAVMTVCSIPLPGTAFAFPGGDGEHHMQRMADDLNLSDEQRQQLRDIHRSNRAEGKRIHDAMQVNRKALHELDPGDANYTAQVVKLAKEQGKLVKRMIIHRSKERAQIYAILTPAQRERAAELMRQHRHENKHNRRRDGQDHHRPM